MKAFYLSRSLLNLQKCLLPDSEFVQENYGRHCFMSTSNADCEFLVKLGLCEIKTIKGAFYVDGSVYKCSSFRQFSEATLLSNVTFNNFTVLKKPLIAKTVKVIVVFFDVYDIQKFKNCKSDLLKILGNVLKLFTFCDKSVLSLKNFDKNQTFGIKYIIINSVDISNHHQPFEVNSNTEIKVEKCITQLKFQQWQMNKNSNEIECCNIVYQILQEAMQLAKMDSQIIKSAKKILLIGPRGCGKRTIIHSLAYKNDFILLEIAAANINSTEGQIQLRNIFDKAKIYLNNDENCIILIKNIDMISGKGKHSKKVIGELINLIKDVENMVGIIIIATTHSLSDVDMGLRGHKRFEDEIEILVPTADERKDIISQILGSCKINCDKDLISQLSKQTAGFVGSDLKLVITEALLSLQKFQV